MQVSERGAPRKLAGFGWTVLLLIAVFGAWVASLIHWAVVIVFVLLGAVVAVKAYGAFTGVKRFGKPSTE